MPKPMPGLESRESYIGKTMYADLQIFSFTKKRLVLGGEVYDDNNNMTLAGWA
jgi:hypothetical protein